MLTCTAHGMPLAGCRMCYIETMENAGFPQFNSEPFEPYQPRLTFRMTCGLAVTIGLIACAFAWAFT